MFFGNPFATVAPTVPMASRPSRAVDTDLAWPRRKPSRYLALLGRGVLYRLHGLAFRSSACLVDGT